uniref:precorrin-6y C5,15-methyltransferase (decarboxylating) subunit CbiE n=1 Tax=Actinomadura roseirufa TaxID=2094049 RepID=UPI001F5E8EE3
MTGRVTVPPAHREGGGGVLTVIGRDGAPLPESARAAVRDAGLLVGPSHHLEGLPVAPGARVVPADALADVLEVLDGPESRSGNVVVVAAGDPGFFGVVRALRARGHEPRVLPAASLVGRAFARIGLPWEDALVVSSADLRRAVNVCRAHPKVAVLTRPGAGPGELARALFPQTPRSFVVCEDLDGPRERVVHVRPAEATTRPWNDPDVVLVLDDRRALTGEGWSSGAGPGPSEWALPQSAFGGEGTLGPEVRAFVLAKLGPRLGDMVWDIGSGDGSVGIECARFGAAVVSLEQDQTARARVRENVRAHGVKVALASGELPLVLDHMPEPDAVFVGRGGPDAVRACAAREASRVVATAPPDDVPALLEALAGHGF